MSLSSAPPSVQEAYRNDPKKFRRMAEAGGKASAKKRAENRREANARAEEEALLQQLRKNSKRKRLRDAHAHEQQLTAGLPPDD